MSRIFLKFLTITICAGMLAGQGWAAPVMREFSADMVSQGQGQTMQAKIYVGREKTRMEMPQNIVITRMDRKVSWVIMPSQGMYMEQPMDPNMAARTATKMEGELERTSLGWESVDGKPAEKFRVTYTVNGTSQMIFQWINKEGFPVKSAAVDGSWSVEYRNIRVGAQPDSLFEVPPGYQKFAMPSMAGIAAMARRQGNMEEN